MKKWVLQKIVWVCIFILILSWFYVINHKNYVQQKKIDFQNVEHPENLPTSESAKFHSFWFQNISADIYWLKAIQYIGSNVIQEDYKKYLWAMMGLITDLNPYFESPYVIGQLLLPWDKYNRNEADSVQTEKNLKQAELLWLKGVENFCDMEKVRAIIAEDDLWKILTLEKYKNPCKGFKIPYYLAYIYYFYLNDNTSAADYYKVVSAQDDAPSWAKVLAAIMQWKWGQREKSLYMFLSLADSTGSEGEACSFMSSELQLVYEQIKNNTRPLDWALVESIENLGKQVLPELTEENENEILDDTKCTNYLAKAIREINLMYIENADAQYVIDNPSEISAGTPEKLFEEWYIDFIPTDYQQYADEWYGIIYKYSEETQWFDYEMDYSWVDGI